MNVIVLIDKANDIYCYITFSIEKRSKYSLLLFHFTWLYDNNSWFVDLDTGQNYMQQLNYI